MHKPSTRTSLRFRHRMYLIVLTPSKSITHSRACFHFRSSCEDNTNACLADGAFAQCVGGKFVSQACGGPGTDLICAALPLVNKAGTSVTCTTAVDRDARIQNALGSAGFIASDVGNSETYPDGVIAFVGTALFQHPVRRDKQLQTQPWIAVSQNQRPLPRLLRLLYPTPSKNVSSSVLSPQTSLVT